MKLSKLLIATTFIISGVAHSASTFQLDLTADGSSQFRDVFSNAFAQIDKPFSGSQVNDGFFCIGDDGGALCTGPGVEIGGGFDVFPNESAFTNVGTLEYDNTGITGTGVEIANITGLMNPNFNQHVASINVFGAVFDTVVSGISGTVTLFDGSVSSINFSSLIQFIYPGSGLSGNQPLPFTGSFSIVDNLFAVSILGEQIPFGDGFFIQEWELTGTVDNLTPVPVPAALLLFPSALALLGFFRRQKQLQN
ncbi:MAG: hypothetical protein AAGB35_04465 [Pseudomonadota bacterium]